MRRAALALRRPLPPAYALVLRDAWALAVADGLLRESPAPGLLQASERAYRLLERPEELKAYLDGGAGR
jgi:hypothetical protein